MLPNDKARFGEADRACTNGHCRDPGPDPSDPAAATSFYVAPKGGSKTLRFLEL